MVDMMTLRQDCNAPKRGEANVNRANENAPSRGRILRLAHIGFCSATDCSANHLRVVEQSDQMMPRSRYG